MKNSMLGLMLLLLGSAAPSRAMEVQPLALENATSLLSLQSGIEDLRKKITAAGGNLKEIEDKMHKEVLIETHLKEMPLLAYTVLEGLNPLEKSGGPSGQSLLSITTQENVARTLVYLRAATDYLNLALAHLYSVQKAMPTKEQEAAKIRAAIVPIPPVLQIAGFPAIPAKEGVPLPLPQRGAKF